MHTLIMAQIQQIVGVVIVVIEDFFMVLRQMVITLIFMNIRFLPGKPPASAGDVTEHRLLEHVLKRAEKGNAQAVVKSIDAYCWKNSWMMCIGDKKGALLDSYVRSCNPAVALELGTYCAYSTIRIASAMQRPSSKLISLEMSAAYADIAKHIIDHAGLSSKVQVINGILSTRKEELKQQLRSMNATTFEFVFIDHFKESYLPDFLLLKEAGLISKGTTIFADNMTIPDSPKFKNYLNTHREEMDTIEHKSHFEYSWWLPDSVTVSTCK